MNHIIRIPILFLLLFSVNLFAAPSYSCNGENILNINEATDDANMSYSENSNGDNLARYFKFTPAVGGKMTVSYGQNASLSEEKQTLFIGTSCDNNDIYSQVNGELSDSATFYVSAGSTYYVKIQEKNVPKDLRFTADFNFKALKVGFEQSSYSIAEDINIADGATQILDIKLVLSYPVDFDVSVDYTTVDGTATSISDYTAFNGTVTFLAGQTEKTISAEIVHDVPVELEENFFFELSNISPSNGIVSIGDYSPTEIIILEQTTAQLCFSDDFNTALDPDWRLLFSQNGSGGATFTPAAINGRLRMTPAENQISTAVTKDYEFKASENLIIVTFDQFAYGGSGGTNGADGIGVVLYDTTIGASPVPGAFGGSLGYAQKLAALSDAVVDIPGFEGAWLGLGIDEYGNYSNPTEGREGGPGFRTNAVAIRGRGSLTSGYQYLAGTNSLTPPLGSTSASAYSGGSFRMTIDSRDPSAMYITLERDADRDGSYESVIIPKTDFIAQQGASPEYVRLSITSSTGGANNIHEIDNLSVRGVCRAYPLSPTPNVVSKADIVNDFIDSATYNAGTKYITTKVAAKTESITGVYLNDSGDSETYSSTDDPDLVYRIIPYLSDATCSTKEIIRDTNGNPAVISIVDGQASADIDVVMPPNASRNSRFRVSALDFDDVYQNSGMACVKNSTTTGNLQGVSACVDSWLNYQRAFGDIAYQRCKVNNGAPCAPENHGKSCGGGENLSDAEKAACDYEPLYDDDYGCLMCTLDANTTCSSDNFAIRPDKLDISTTDTSYPDLLLAGEDYRFKIYAYNSGVSSGEMTTDNYTIANADTNLTITQRLLKKDGTPAVGGELSGAFSWSGSFDMLDGKSTNGASNEVATVNFSDIGKVTLQVQDKSWAAVDTGDVNGVNDATTHDCNGAYACGETNTTFIPHHFSFTNPAITNRNGNPGTFTYLSNLIPGDTSTYDMAVRVITGIQARNKNENITQNFKTGVNYYENPVTLNISFNDPVHGNANTTSINNTLLEFGKDNGDINGTKSLVWADTNLSKVLRFNFPRSTNSAVNPFDLNATDLNITLSSNYSGTAPIGNAVISSDNSGISTATGSAKMLYGRTHASRQRYEGNSGTANIYYEVFCFRTDSNGVTCNKNLLPNGINSKRTDDIRWFINENHTVVSGNAGKVVEKDSKNNVTSAGVTSGNHPDNSTLMTYNENIGYPYKTTMENNASSWLIYNPDDPTATRNEFSVEFEKTVTGWSGEHETDTTTKDPVSVKTNRRVLW